MIHVCAFVCVIERYSVCVCERERESEIVNESHLVAESWHTVRMSDDFGPTHTHTHTHTHGHF